MKKVLLVLLVSLLFLTGCENGEINETKLDEEETKQVNQMVDFLTKNVLDSSPSYKNNRFYIFTKDGKFAHYYGSRIVLTEADNVLLTVGKYYYSRGRITLKYEYDYIQKYNENNGSYNLVKQENTQEYTYGDFKIVTREREKDDYVYVAGKGLRLEKKDDNVPEELVKQMREYLDKDFEGFDFNRVKSLEEYDKLNGV